MAATSSGAPPLAALISDSGPTSSGFALLVTAPRALPPPTAAAIVYAIRRAGWRGLRRSPPPVCALSVTAIGSIIADGQSLDSAL